MSYTCITLCANTDDVFPEQIIGEEITCNKKVNHMSVSDHTCDFAVDIYKLKYVPYSHITNQGGQISCQKILFHDGSISSIFYNSLAIHLHKLWMHNLSI